MCSILTEASVMCYPVRQNKNMCFEKMALWLFRVTLIQFYDSVCVYACLRVHSLRGRISEGVSDSGSGCRFSRGTLYS